MFCAKLEEVDPASTIPAKKAFTTSVRTAPPGINRLLPPSKLQKYFTLRYSLAFPIWNPDSSVSCECTPHNLDISLKDRAFARAASRHTCCNTANNRASADRPPHFAVSKANKSMMGVKTRTTTSNDRVRPANSSADRGDSGGNESSDVLFHPS